MSDNGQQVPLIEQLRSVPAAARVLEHTPNPLGYDTASIPVGALCREAAARIAELEADLERMIAARNRDHQQALENGAAAAAERAQRKAAEVLLSWLAMRGKWGNEERDAVAAHFARYEEDRE